MPATYEVIGTATASSTVTSITLSGIPSTYTDLVIVANIKSMFGEYGGLRINNDSSSNYSTTRLQGNGSTASSNRTTGLADRYFFNGGSNFPTANFSLATAHILSYTNTSIKKTIISQHANDKNGSGSSDLSVGVWHSTAAVTSVTLYPNAVDNLAAGSSLTIYGIKRA